MDHFREINVVFEMVYQNPNLKWNEDNRMDRSNPMLVAIIFDKTRRIYEIIIESTIKCFC